MRADLLDVVQRVLVEPVTMTTAESWRKPGTYVSDDTIVWFPKLLLVEKGGIEYWIDGERFALPAGWILYRPAWTRSNWRSSKRSPMHVSFCEFDFPTAGTLCREPLALKLADPKYETQVLHRIIELRSSLRREHLLLAAAELKGMLARVFIAAAEQSKVRPSSPVTSAMSSAVQDAMDFVSRNLSRPDVLSDLTAKLEVSPGRFREAFRGKIGMSPQQYLLTMRMRAARYYLTDSREPLKRVAMHVGYDDPLYFSRMYRKFWGHPPSADRNLIATGARPGRLSVLETHAQ